MMEPLRDPTEPVPPQLAADLADAVRSGPCTAAAPRPRSRVARMAGAVRWRYVTIRAALVGVVVLGVRYGLDPALKWALEAGGSAALGARVEVAELTTSLRDGQIVITRLAAANPSKPMRNLIEASDMRLVVDPGQLLRKRLVVRSGRIEGMRFDGPRSESGALQSAPPSPEAGPSPLDPVLDAAADGAAAWLTALEDRAAGDLEAKLATPRLARELAERWPGQYEGLKARAGALGAQAKQIEQQFREVKKNPLRGAAQLETLRADLTAAQAELKSVAAEIAALPEQAKGDRAAIDAARKQDEAFLKDTLRIAQVDGQQLTQYLLGEEVNGYVEQTVYWVETVRRYLPKKKMARPERSRGVDVVFGSRRRPRVLIERVEMTAAAQWGGTPLDLVGELVDAASEPEWHDRPARLLLRSTGAVGATLVAEFDRRGAVAHDTLLLDCPQLALPGRALGRADRLALKVAPGDAAIHAELRIDGDALAGTIELRQAAHLDVAAGALRDDRLVQVLHESLAGIDRVEAAVQVTGTLKRPRLKIESSLGPELAQGISGALRKYVDDRKERLLAKVRSGVDDQLSALDAKRQAAQQELLAKLGDNQKILGQLAGLAGGRPSLDDAIPELSRQFDLSKLRK